MCEPKTLALATTAVGAASDVLGFVGQRQAYRENERAANINYGNRLTALQDQQNQMDAADAERAVDESILQVQEQGRIATVASEQFSAATQARLLNASLNEQSRAEAVADLNSQNQRVQLGRERRGAEIERVNQINKVAKPSAAALALQLGGRTLQGASDYKTMTKG